MKLIKTSILLTIIAFYIMGCAQKPVEIASANNSEHQQQLNVFLSWQIKARVSIQTQDEAFSASLLWQQRPSEQLVELNGMLGQNYARIQVNPEIAQLRIEDNQVYEAKLVEELMLNHLGYIIPVTAMTNWLKGATAGATAEQWQLNEQGYVKQLRDRGWLITYKRYEDYPGLSMSLPSRMTFSNGRETIKVAVQSWSAL